MPRTGCPNVYHREQPARGANLGEQVADINSRGRGERRGAKSSRFSMTRPQ